MCKVTQDEVGKEGQKDRDSVLSTLSCPEPPMSQTLMSSLASRLKEGICFVFFFSPWVDRTGKANSSLTLFISGKYLNDIQTSLCPLGPTNVKGGLAVCTDFLNKSPILTTG